MRLHTYVRSSAADRVRIALNRKGVAHEPAYVHLVRAKAACVALPPFQRAAPDAQMDAM